MALDRLSQVTSSGISTTISFRAAGINVSGIVTATTFVGALTGTASNVTTNANLTGDVTSTGNATSIAAGVIVDADISASAAIALSKLATTGILTATTFVGALTGNASSATIATYTSEWILGANGSLDYTFTGPGFTGAENDPVLYLVRGQQYKFTNTMGAHPFRIQSTVNGSTGTQYNDGITNNDVSNGTLTWDVQFDAPNILYYQCTAHSGMGGKIYILNSEDNVSAGTTAAPSISPTGDSNTGIFFPSADTIAFAKGGVEALRVDSSGNLGIGTNNPTTELEVLGTATVASFRGKGGSSFIGIKDEDDGTLAFIGVDGGSLKFQTSGSGYSDKLIIDTSGNLGINSTSPARKLDVVDSGANGSVIRSKVTTNNGGYLAYEALNSSGTSVFSVNHNGGITLAGNVIFASGQGLDFSATSNAAGMTSELLDDYEEGTFTPTADAGITINSGTPAYSGFYTKIGRIVNITISQTAGNITVTAGGRVFAGLPFTPGTQFQACSVTNGSPNISGTGLIYNSPGTGAIYIGFTATSVTNIAFTGTYFV